jgi:hypothetical protein
MELPYNTEDLNPPKKKEKQKERKKEQKRTLFNCSFVHHASPTKSSRIDPAPVQLKL